MLLYYTHTHTTVADAVACSQETLQNHKAGHTGLQMKAVV